MSDRDTYLDRNLPWLSPAFTTVALVFLPVFVDILGGELGIAFMLPKWFPIAGGIFGSFLTGLRAMYIETISARIVRLVGTGVGVGICIATVFH